MMIDCEKPTECKVPWNLFCQNKQKLQYNILAVFSVGIHVYVESVLFFFPYVADCFWFFLVCLYPVHLHDNYILISILCIAS